MVKYWNRSEFFKGLRVYLKYMKADRGRLGWLGSLTFFAVFFPFSFWPSSAASPEEEEADEEEEEEELVEEEEEILANSLYRFRALAYSSESSTCFA